MSKALDLSARESYVIVEFACRPDDDLPTQAKGFAGELSIPDAAKILHCSGTTIRKWIEMGMLEVTVWPQRGRAEYSYKVLADSVMRLKKERGK